MKSILKAYLICIISIITFLELKKKKWYFEIFDIKKACPIVWACWEFWDDFKFSFNFYVISGSISKI